MRTYIHQIRCDHQEDRRWRCLFSSFVCLVPVSSLFCLCSPLYFVLKTINSAQPLPSLHSVPPFPFFFKHLFCHLLLLLQPSSSTNALVLSGACDPPEPAPPAHAAATAPVLTPSTITEAETATALETSTTSSSLPVSAPSFFSAITPAPIRHASSFSSYSTPSITSTTTAAATTTDADMDGTATHSLMYHAASSSLSASGNSPLRDQSFIMFPCLAGTR